MEPTIQRDLEVDRALGDALRVASRNYGPYVLFMALIAGPPTAWLQWQSLKVGGAPDFSVLPMIWLGSLIAWVAMKLGHSQIMIHGFGQLRGSAPSLGAATRRALTRWPVLVLTAIVFFILVSVASVFFCIPGILVFVVFFPVQAIVTLEQPSPMRAFSRAMDLTSGQRLSIFGVGAIVFLSDLMLTLPSVITTLVAPDNMLLGIVLATGKTILFEPVRAAVMTSVYFHLRRNAEGLDVDDVAEVFA